MFPLPALLIAAAALLPQAAFAENAAPAPLPTPAAAPAQAQPIWSLPALAQLSDEECLALYSYMQQALRRGYAALADELAGFPPNEPENWEPYEQRRAAFARAFEAFHATPPDGLPHDFRDYLGASLALVNERQQAEKELQHTADDASFYQSRAELLGEYLQKFRELNERFPRASALLSQGLLDAAFLREMRNKSSLHAFLKEHPKLPLNTPAEKHAAQIAYWRYRADLPQPEPDLAAARAQIIRTALGHFACYPPNQLRATLGQSAPTTLHLPQNERTGYGWKLAAPLPPDAPCTMECRRLTPEEWVAEGWADGICHHLWEEATQIDVVTLRPAREGTILLRFILTHPEDIQPVYLETTEYTVSSPLAR